MIESTVSEYLFGPCSESLMNELALESQYWETVADFVNENSEEYVADLTFKQRQWLFKIKEDLLEKAQE